MKKTSYKEFSMYEGDGPLTDMSPTLWNMGALCASTISPEPRLPNPQPTQEEQVLRQQDVRTASLIFERNRVPVRPALRAILAACLDRHGINCRAGLDIGSGATGEMVGELLPRESMDSSRWGQIDINPAAVAENRRRHPSANVSVGSYLNLGRSEFDLVTGLSSLDATSFLDLAINQVGKALKPGGFLVHMQDVRPGLGFGIREMEYMGVQAPFKGEMLSGPGNIYNYRLPNGEVLNVGECFRRALGRAIQNNPGFDLLENQWVTAVRGAPDQIEKWYHMNILLQAGPIPQGAREQVSAVMTVARKKS